MEALDTRRHAVGLDAEPVTEPEPAQRRAPTPGLLYEIKRQHRPDLWQFIRLVAADEFVNLPDTELKSSHAKGAYCLKCEKPVTFTIANNDTRKHMETFHMDSIIAYQREKKRKQATTSRALEIEFSSCSEPSMKRKLTQPTPEEQQEANTLLAHWIARSLRPLSMVEDDGFKAYMDFIARHLGGVVLAIPGRTQVRGDIQRIARELRTKLMKRLQSGCAYYSLTTDLWTSRALHRYMAVTIHYVDALFQPQSWTLEVQHFPGKHTGVAIAQALEGVFQRWDLEKRCCTKLLRDGASNAVRAGDVLDVGHMSCIAHSIHLVVGAALLKKNPAKPRGGTPITSGPTIDRRESAGIDDETALGHVREHTSGEPSDGHVADTAGDIPVDIARSTATPTADHDDIADGDSDNREDDGSDVDPSEREVVRRLRDDACDEMEGYIAASIPSSRTPMDTMRSNVQTFRSIAVYFKRSSKATNRLGKFQRDLEPDPQKQSLSLIVDCPTRWNSTWDMIQRFVALRTALDHFFAYLDTSDGKLEFSGVRPTRPKPEHWFQIKCLPPFTTAVELMSRQNYPTLAVTLPCLRYVKINLENRSVFQLLVGIEGHQSYVPGSLELMHQVRTAMFELYTKRFSGMQNEVRWTTLLDPRLIKSKHMSSTERETATEELLLAAAKMAYENQPEAPPASNGSILLSPIAPPREGRSALHDMLFGSDDDDDTANGCVIRSLDDCRAACETEFFQYVSALTGTPVKMTGNPFEWWQINHLTFPMLAALARKWLGCVSTSVPSERAFSTGGNTVTTKRCSLSPDLVRDIIFISENCSSEDKSKSKIK